MKVGRSAAAATGPGRFLLRSGGFILIESTVAARSLESEHAVEDGCCAAHSGPYMNRARGAVPRAGPAFDAGVLVDDVGLLTGKRVYGARADNSAHAAADAFFTVEFKGDNVFEVNKLSHADSFR